MPQTQTEWLSDWEIVALETLVREAAESGRISRNHGRALWAKLEKASRVRISFPRGA